MTLERLPTAPAVSTPKLAAGHPWESRPRVSRFPGWLKSAPFIVLHLALLTVFLVPVSAGALALCAATYLLRMFGITGGYHRYFAHRAYKTSRVFQFVLACLG